MKVKEKYRQSQRNPAPKCHDLGRKPVPGSTPGPPTVGWKAKLQPAMRRVPMHQDARPASVIPATPSYNHLAIRLSQADGKSDRALQRPRRLVPLPSLAKDRYVPQHISLGPACYHPRHAQKHQTKHHQNKYYPKLKPNPLRGRLLRLWEHLEFPS